MKEEFIKTFEGLKIKPYYLELYSYLFIFALNAEQYIEALQWYNKNIEKVFSSEDIEKYSSSRGLTASHVTEIENKIKIVFQCIYVPIDSLISREDLFIQLTQIQNLMSTANHEIEHAVLNCGYHLRGEMFSPLNQEPLAYLAGWITERFFEEAQRQGYSFTITKKDQNANTK